MPPSYYDTNAETYFTKTVGLDLSEIYERFLKELPENALILDAGCGSGRDIKFFAERGYQIEAFDHSGPLVAKARAYTNLPIKIMSFLDLNEIEKYDGIWACASLLHLEPSQLQKTFSLLARALKADGTIYCSFKKGNGIVEHDGRVFHNFTIESLELFLKRDNELTINSSWYSAGKTTSNQFVREDWSNFLLKTIG